MGRITLAALLCCGLFASSGASARKSRRARRARQAHAQRVRQAQAQRVRQAQAQRVRQAQAQRIRQAQAKRIRQAQAQRIRQAHAQRIRQAQAQRIRQAQAQRIRQAQAKRIRQARATQLRQAHARRLRQARAMRPQQRSVRRVTRVTRRAQRSVVRSRRAYSRIRPTNRPQRRVAARSLRPAQTTRVVRRPLSGRRAAPRNLGPRRIAGFAEKTLTKNRPNLNLGKFARGGHKRQQPAAVPVLRPVERYTSFVQEFESNRTVITPDQEVLVQIIGFPEVDSGPILAGTPSSQADPVPEIEPPVRVQDFARRFSLGGNNPFGLIDNNIDVDLSDIARAVRAP